jgi:ATP-binding protein involved in chromosome partitioning
MNFFKSLKSHAEEPPKQPGVHSVKHVIAVASAKGGVGKSTTAVFLARFLKELNFKVGLLDADIQGPSLPTMVKIDRAPRPVSDTDNTFYPAESQGILFLSYDMFNDQKKAQIMRGPMVSNVLKQLLTQCIWGTLDYLIVDYPPGTGDIQLTLSQVIPMSGAVLVSTPQEVSLADTRKAVQMFHTLKVPVIGVIETMSWFVCDGCDKKHFIFPRTQHKTLTEEFGIPLLAQIPLDLALSKICDEGLSLHTKNLSAGMKAYQTGTQEFLHYAKNMQEAVVLGR